MRIYCEYYLDDVSQPVFVEEAWTETQQVYDKRYISELELHADFTRNIQYIEDGQPEGRVLVRWEYWLKVFYVEIGNTAQDVLDFLAPYTEKGIALTVFNNQFHLVGMGD
jgi:hypothetical protein